MSEFLLQNRLAFGGLIIVSILMAVALLAPWLVIHDPSAQELSARLSSPSWEHPFGTDRLGRDLLSRSFRVPDSASCPGFRWSFLPR